MTSRKEVARFLKSQQSIQFYPKVYNAFETVFLKMPKKDFEITTNNLILMVLHEGALAQVMHFTKSHKFKVLQLSVAKRVPAKVLRYLVAHELGHVMQGRNWSPNEGLNLEEDADNWAKKWGFPDTKNIAKWRNDYSLKF